MAVKPDIKVEVGFLCLDHKGFTTMVHNEGLEKANLNLVSQDQWAPLKDMKVTLLLSYGGRAEFKENSLSGARTRDL